MLVKEVSKMSGNRKQKPRKRTWAFYTIIVSLIILVLPVAYLGVTGIRSLLERGTPLVGDRYQNDLDPAIKDKDLETLKTALAEYEQVNISLKTSTLRIYVLNDSITESNMNDFLTGVYEKVLGVFDKETYFTTRGVQKQYDLEIHAFNDSEEAYAYGLLVKNANMEEPLFDLLSEPRSQEIVDYFYEVDVETQSPEAEAEGEVSEENVDEAEGE